MRLLGIKKPTGVPWAKTTSRVERERKTDNNYRLGLSRSRGLLQLLTGHHHGAYMDLQVPKNVVPAEAGTQACM
jgi:hypothetical protein